MVILNCQVYCVIVFQPTASFWPLLEFSPHWNRWVERHLEGPPASGPAIALAGVHPTTVAERGGGVAWRGWVVLAWVDGQHIPPDSRQRGTTCRVF